MTDIILDAHASDSTGYLGIPVTMINWSGHPKNLGPKKNKPYFFLDVQDSTRHCRIYGSQFLDYTAGCKVFDKLEDWAADCGHDISLIMFGFDVGEDDMYAGVNICHYFDYVSDFMVLERKLSSIQLGIENVAVVVEIRVIMATDFMQE